MVAIYSVDQAGALIGDYSVTTPLYAVFYDPNGTFPPYYAGDIDYGTLQRKPWYEIIDSAIDHVTKSGTDQTVTAMGQAMENLTRDLYVWPNRDRGPGTSIYDYQNPSYYGKFWSGGPLLRFDLSGMAHVTDGDCRDFSAYLECQADSLGIPSVAKIQLDDMNPDYGFHTNTVLPAGSPYWRTYDFNYHRMVTFPSFSPYLIYDWAAALWPDPGSSDPWKLTLGATQAEVITNLVAYGEPIPWPPGQEPWSTPFALGPPDPFYDGVVLTILSSRPY